MTNHLLETDNSSALDSILFRNSTSKNYSATIWTVIQGESWVAPAIAISAGAFSPLQSDERAV